MKFKVYTLEDEFTRIDEQLRHILLWCDIYSNQYFSKDVTVTCLFRTIDDQRKLYPDKNPPPYSSHLDGRGADLRSHSYSKDQIDQFVKAINDTFPRTDGKPTAMCHTIPGNVPHFHIQWL